MLLDENVFYFLIYKYRCWGNKLETSTTHRGQLSGLLLYVFQSAANFGGDLWSTSIYTGCYDIWNAVFPQKRGSKGGE